MSTEQTIATAAEVARTYLRAWRERDWDTLRSILADDVTFRGPLASIDGADGAVAGLQGMSQIMTDVDVHAIVADGDDVISWFDLHTSIASPAPTANWSHVENGRITAIRVTFDAREIAAAG